ncbi:hypothetical protein COT72_04680 [archaeon CG10_big_fil_rev_8_21_14_0_10_43_11]|nr:MAG: hypothetical protein COT72_04680 [archaeon CG10_big_fil_rev_8_21_14_0_10_43_11]
MIVNRAKKRPHMFIFDAHPTLAYLVRSLYNAQTDTLSQHVSEHNRGGLVYDNILGRITGSYLTFEFGNGARLSIPSGVPIAERTSGQCTGARNDALAYFSKLAKQTSKGVIVDELHPSLYKNMFDNTNYLVLNVDKTGNPVNDGSLLASMAIDFPRLVFMSSSRCDVAGLLAQKHVPLQFWFLKSPDLSQNNLDAQYANVLESYKTMLHDFTGRSVPESDAVYGVYKTNYDELVHYVFKDHLAVLLEQNSDPVNDMTMT